ncbi:MAG: hypothetical protein U0326_40730 [Polyangiales bacterium]
MPLVQVATAEGASDRASPRFVALVAVLTSRPLNPLWSRSAWPRSQAPVVHSTFFLRGSRVQDDARVPQALQLLASVMTLASQPLLASPSQLNSPARRSRSRRRCGCTATPRGASTRGRTAPQLFASM